MIPKALLLVFGLIVFFLQIPAYADMGAIVSSPIQVNEEAQKALILHNGRQEVLILGTDLKAEKETKIIRFIPFPSEPRVSLAKAEVFELASHLMRKHGVVLVAQYKTLGPGGGTSARPVEMRFHKRIGAHEVSVIKVNSPSFFRSWVDGFFKKMGLRPRKLDPLVEEIVNNYVQRGLKYFAFDFVEISEETRSVSPLAYRFRSRKIYYPLITSNSLARGQQANEIDLIFITPRTFFKPSFYNANYNFLVLPKPSGGAIGLWEVSTSSYVSKKELTDLYPESPAFFKGYKNLVVQFVHYRGLYSFDTDIYNDFSFGSPYSTGHPLSSPLFGFSLIVLNKPGVELKSPPRSWIETERARLGLDRLVIVTKEGIPMIRLGKMPGRRTVSLSSSVDLSRWFKNKKCAESWDSFQECLNRHENPEDEKLYQRIDREFYAKLICQRRCEDEDFLKWEVHWYSPGYMVIRAPIGERGGFESLKEARASLRKINRLLKRVVYGARFPESYGEGRTPEEVFSTNDLPVFFDYSKAVLKFLNDLIKEGFLTGLSAEEVEKISAVSKAGKQILFVGRDCPSNPYIPQRGWVSFEGSIWVDFETPACPLR